MKSLVVTAERITFECVLKKRHKVLQKNDLEPTLPFVRKQVLHRFGSFPLDNVIGKWKQQYNMRQIADVNQIPQYLVILEKKFLVYLFSLQEGRCLDHGCIGIAKLLAMFFIIFRAPKTVFGVLHLHEYLMRVFVFDIKIEGGPPRSFLNG